MDECIGCLNAGKCFRCNDFSLYKTKDNKTSGRITATVHSTKDKNADNSWELLEEDMVKELKKIPTMPEIRRAKASGALWYEKSDVIHNILQLECKERTGTLLANGEKSFSVKKEWLTKAEREALDEGKTMALPFRFKGDDDTYIIVKSDSLIELVNHINAYIRDNKLKDAEIEVLKKRINHFKKGD